MFFNGCFIMFVNMINGKEGILRLKALLGFVFQHWKKNADFNLFLFYVMAYVGVGISVMKNISV